MNNVKIKLAIKDILWMARRYADRRQTYAPSMFNDAYDVLRKEFGEEIDPKTHPAHDPNIEEKSHDVMLEDGHIHPYAYYGEHKDSQSNQELKHRKYYGK